METTTKKLSEIKPYWRNPRINEHAVEAMIESLKEYGQTMPILVDSEFVIIAGHTRYKAMVRLEWTHCEVKIADDMTPDQVAAYRIIDNKMSEKSRWDQDKLQAELHKIDVKKFEVFFPELKLAEAKLDFKPITEDKMDSSKNFFEDNMKTSVEERQEKVRTMTCPHCLKDFDTTTGA